MNRTLCTALLLVLPHCVYETKCIAVDGVCRPDVTYFLFRTARGVSPAGNPSATAPSSVSGLIFLFQTTTNSTGVLGGVGGRSGADNLCASSRSSYAFPDNSCTSTRAFISIVAGDQILNMPANYGVPSANEIQGPTGISVSPGWTALLSGSISVSLNGAGVLPPATAWASYSTSAGTLAGSHCTNGTLTGLSGQVGSSGSTAAAWIDNGTGLCITPTTLLCVCY